MRNVWLIAQHEIRTTLGKRSFWFTTFIFPLFILAMTFGSQLLSERLVSAPPEGGNGAAGAPPPAVGYVDEAGLIRRTPPDMPEGWVIAYPSEGAARQALAAGTIARYYRIPADFLATGDITLVEQSYTPLASIDRRDAVRALLYYNLVGDVARSELVQDPLPNVRLQSLQPQAQVGGDGLAFAVPYATVFIMFFVLTLTSTYMLRSVTTEKETRMVEVLLTSLRPRDLMLGKVLGLGAVGLLQMAIWAGGALAALRQRLAAIPRGVDATAFSLPPGFLWWVLAYFLLGYVLFSSILAALGALAPTAREANQFTFLVLLPLMLPLWLNATFMQAPNGSLATFLSLFPLTAPVAMVTRLVTGVVPPWQPVVGLALLAVTAYVFVLLSARLFKAGTLLSTASLDVRRLREALAGRSG